MYASPMKFSKKVLRLNLSRAIYQHFFEALHLAFVVSLSLLIIGWVQSKRTITTGAWLCSAYESIFCGLLFKRFLFLFRV